MTEQNGTGGTSSPSTENDSVDGSDAPAESSAVDASGTENGASGTDNDAEDASGTENVPEHGAVDDASATPDENGAAHASDADASDAPGDGASAENGAGRATGDGAATAGEAPAHGAGDGSVDEGSNGASENSFVDGFVVEDWMLGALEALVFASSEPLHPARAREVFAAELVAMDPPRREPGIGDVRGMFRSLVERWSDPTRTVALGFRLVEVDGGLVFRTVVAHAKFIRRFQTGRPQKLSRATLETLAVIAYRQPVTKPQIEEVRGVDCSGALKALLDKKLIRVLGKAEEVGRPLLYGTTKTFLELFEMQSLTDLPTLKQLHELETGITEAPVDPDERPAVVMDLFNADQSSAVSEETERESNEAMEALEKALGEAKDVAKRASTLVLGVQVEDDDGTPPTSTGG